MTPTSPSAYTSVLACLPGSRVTAGPPRLRRTFADLTSSLLSMLTDAEFRVLVVLWSYTAGFGNDGQFQRSWARNLP